MQSGPKDQTPQNFQQPQIINAQANGYLKYQSKVATFFGILQIFLGSSILAAAIAIYVTFTKIAVEHGLSIQRGRLGYSQFWVAGLAICAGSFGVRSARTKAGGHIVATMVFSILSSLAILLIIAQGVWFFLLLKIPTGSNEVQYQSSDYIFLVCFGIFLAFGILEFIVAIAAAAYCCNGCCGESRPGVAQPGVILSPYAPPQYDGPYTTQNVENGDPNAYSSMDDEKEFPQDEKNF